MGTSVLGERPSDDSWKPELTYVQNDVWELKDGQYYDRQGRLVDMSSGNDLTLREGFPPYLLHFNERTGKMHVTGDTCDFPCIPCLDKAQGYGKWGLIVSWSEPEKHNRWIRNEEEK